VAPTRKDAHALPRQAFEWDLDILQQLTTPATKEMPRGYEFYEQRGGKLPPFTYDQWLEDRLLFDDPDGCAEKIATLCDASVRRLLLWMGVGASSTTSSCSRCACSRSRSCRSSNDGMIG
jgi:hypothetical protein